jgi:hypothetical protein
VQLALPTPLSPPAPTTSIPSTVPIPSIFNDHPLLPPPDSTAHRYHGFGKRDTQRSITNLEPPLYYIIHLAWDYLSPLDRYILSTDLPIFTAYAILRQEASIADISPLRLPRPPPDNSAVDSVRVRCLAHALLLFNCDYGDMLRWIGGPYTDAHRSWDITFARMETVRHCAPPDRFPTPDYDRTIRACSEGVPLAAHYTSDYASCSIRNLAPLSKDLQDNRADVDETLRKEEKLSYHIILPRFLWRFIPGLLLSIFRVAYRYGDPKPRLCVDPSTTLTPADIGNVNAQIPRPGLDENKNPTIYYGTAFLRYLSWLWNLRITFPGDDIVQMTDDISAAFHRVLYHPDVAPAFASLWDSWLIIPVGTIFGSRSSPSTYMWKGEMRSHLGHHLRLDPAALQEPLIQRIHLPAALSSAESANLAPAAADALNRGITRMANGELERRLPSFVDDTAVAHIREHFLSAAAASVQSAYVIFGHPSEDPTRPPCINPAKWDAEVSHTLLFLGYHVDTRSMMVSWPLAKRQKLKVFLAIILDDHDAQRRSTPLAVSRVLGLIRHAAPVSPMGTHRSLRLQHLFNDVVSAASGIPQLRRWYQRKVVTIPPTIIAELRDFCAHISDDISDPYWCRHIGLLVQRTPTVTVLTDASSKALGGWSSEHELNHMWRITVADLVQAGMPRGVGWQNTHNYHEVAIDPQALHINILEFFAIFIELWICVRQIHIAHSSIVVPNDNMCETLPPGGHRILALADNTSALSWLRYASRTKRAPVRNIARLLTAFLCLPFVASNIRVQGRHIPGVANVEADHLSRFEKSASWEAVMAHCAPLKNLRTCQLPEELLSLLVYCYLKEPTEEWFATATTQLWTIAPPSFATGSARLVGTATSVVRRA